MVNKTWGKDKDEIKSAEWSPEVNEVVEGVESEEVKTALNEAQKATIDILDRNIDKISTVWEKVNNHAFSDEVKLESATIVSRGCAALNTDLTNIINTTEDWEYKDMLQSKQDQLSELKGKMDTYIKENGGEEKTSGIWAEWDRDISYRAAKGRRKVTPKRKF